MKLCIKLINMPVAMYFSTFVINSIRTIIQHLISFSAMLYVDGINVLKLQYKILVPSEHI